MYIWYCQPLKSRADLTCSKGYMWITTHLLFMFKGMFYGFVACSFWHAADYGMQESVLFTFMSFNPFIPADQYRYLWKQCRPDETTHHRDLHCLPFYYWFLTEIPLYNNECIQFQRGKRVFQKLRDERINCVSIWFLGLEVLYLQSFRNMREEYKLTPYKDCHQSDMLQASSHRWHSPQLVFCPFSLADKRDACANSVDPDETACHKLSHQYLHCLPFCFWD